jgi:hypothetical protein
MDRRVLTDIDAFSQLVLLEVRNVSKFDLSADPKRLFADENREYFGIALLSSNVTDYMARVITKIAYVEDAKGEKLRATDDDFFQLPSNERVRIGAYIVGGWVRRGIAKNQPRITQA